MRPKAFVSFVALGALALCAVAAAQVIPAVIEDRVRPEPAGLTIAPRKLPAIVVSAETVPQDMTIYQVLTGHAAIGGSDVMPPFPPGFVDALLTRFDSDDQHEGEHEDRYATLGAVFLTDAHAEQAFRIAAAHHEADTGWRMAPVQDRTLAGAIDVGRGMRGCTSPATSTTARRC